MQKPASAPEGAPTSPRCKIGDLAFIIRSADPGNIGRPVRVLAREMPPPFGYPPPWQDLSHAVHWLVEASSPCATYAISVGATMSASRQWKATGQRFSIPDPCLRPVRDGDGADETLTWADKPVTESVAA